MRWCESHTPPRDGVDDETVTAVAYLSGSAEAGGDDNRRWCEVLHRRRRAAPAISAGPRPAR